MELSDNEKITPYIEPTRLLIDKIAEFVIPKNS
jgi:hypothetical protein